MNKETMKSWINTCLKNFGPFKNLEKSILIMDSFGSHKDYSMLPLLKNNNYEPIIIPHRIFYSSTFECFNKCTI